MRINLLSSFAAGILLSTTVCGVVYFTDKSAVVKTSDNTKTVSVQPSEKDMKDQLGSKGYIVQTKAEYDKNMNAAKSAGQKQAPPADNQSTKQITKVIVNVTDGMTSIDVGNMLAEAKIVPNAFDFSKDIEQKGLENKLRPGVFTVDSEMTYDQVVGTIFK